MTKRNRVAAHRKAWSLSQDELATLLGVRRQTISKLELGQTRPSHRMAFTLEMLFDAPPGQIFTGLCDAAYQALVQRLQKFSTDIESDESEKGVRKRALLSSFARRAANADAI